jgi:hypothetical protein
VTIEVLKKNTHTHTGKKMALTIGSPTSTLPPAPRIIWTYWRGGSLPEVATASMLSWRLFHPDWTIHIVTPDTLPGFVPGLDLSSIAWVSSPMKESDVVRLAVLARHGGVWLDATYLLAAPLNFVQDLFTPVGYEFTGFYLSGFTSKPQWPVVESWALGARPGSLFVTRWRDQFMSAPNTPGGLSDITTMYKRTTDLQRIPGYMQKYLAIHCAAQYVLQHTAPGDNLSMRVFSAEQGPMKYLKDCVWTPASVLLLHATYHPRRNVTPAYPAYKIRKMERVFMPPVQSRRLLERVAYAFMEQ